jgi:tetratricopeptide (TPR) repeat protein
MAPEQLFGDAVTAKSDQFSFCATLYEAVYGVRPFPGASLDAIKEAMRAGSSAESNRAVPAAIARAVRRGLEIDPERRFADMPALLAALRPARSVWRWRAVWLGASAAAIATTAVVMQREPAPSRCVGFEAQLAGVWDATKQRAMQTALASDAPYARAAIAETTRRLERYAAGWVAARTSACEATHVRGDQSERVMDLRMRCLDRRRAELGGLVTALIAGGKDAVARSVDAATSLEPLASCADIEALESTTRPPPPPEVAKLADELVTARSELAIGRFRESAKIATRVVEVARTLKARELEAEALFVSGQVTFRLGDAAAAEAMLGDSALAAESVRRDDVAARARIAHVAAAIAATSFDAARERVRAATAAVERVGSPIALRMELATQEGVLAATQGEYEKARGFFATALELAEKLHGEDNLAVARATNNVGNALYSLGRYAEARAAHERALTMRRAALGDDHPDIATTLVNLAHDLSQEGKSADAIDRYRDAVRIMEATSPQNPRVATTHSDIGLELESLGRIDEAIAAHRKAVAILERGKRGPELGLAHENLASALFASKRNADALAEHRLALAIREEILGAEHPDVAQTLTNMGRVHLALDDFKAARAALDRSLAIKTKALGADHVRVAPTLIALGELALAQKQPAAAIAPLDRARALLANGAPLDLATCQLLLARALRAANRAADARPHALAAAAAFAAAGKTEQATQANAVAK